MGISLDITAALTIILEPFLPFSTEKIRNFLNIEQLGWDKLGERELLVPGHQINKPALLFEKIEDEQIEFQVTKLLNTKKENASEASFEPVKPEITFDDFQKWIFERE
jgi:methionyl-tRNA synthetase